MSDKIELGMLCGVLQSNFSRLSQSESRTQPCHVRICNFPIYCTYYFEFVLPSVYFKEVII